MKKQNGNQKVSNMKRHLLYGFLFALVAAGCYQEELSVTPQTDCEGRTYTASFEDNETRTYVEDDVLLRWTAGDQISLFDGNTLNRQYKFDGETGDNSGTFSIVDAPYGSGNDLTANYAVYPYASGVKISESGVITAALPAEQTYAENSFGPGANTMVAVTKDKTDTFLRFKNVCGYLKLQLYGKNVTVKSITLTGNNNEKVAGAAAITPSYSGTPTVSMAEDATGTITLDCGEGVRIGTTSETVTAFWIAVPPTTFDEGFEVTITDTDGGTFTKSTSKKISIERNVVKPMAAFEVEIETIPNNQIWYTSSDGRVLVPNKTDGFGADIVSNTYENGKGIITFAVDVTTIGENAFASCNYLTSIVLPNSVTAIERCAFLGCQSLTNITIPDSVTDIGNAVFVGCTNLKEFKGKFASDGGRCLIKDNALIAYANASGKEYTIPDNVTTIWNGAFGNCFSLIEITVPDNVTTIQPASFVCPNLKTINGKYATDDRRFYIMDGAIKIFAASGLSECVIPDGVTKIETQTFMGVSFTNLTIPESVTEISNNAIANCYNLTNIYCKPATPPTAVFDYNSWFFCSGNVTIYVPVDSVLDYRKAAGWKNYAECIVAYDFDKEEAVISDNIIYYTSVDGTIVEPKSKDAFGAKIISNTYENDRGTIVFDRDVLTIPTDAFKWNGNLASIVIPDSVTEIRYCAFYECSNLTSITIGDNVTFIGDSAFWGCSKLISVYITDIASWCNITFDNANSNPLARAGNLYLDGKLLTNLVIPDSIASIGDYAFSCCSSITSVKIPDSVTSIGTEAFYYCDKLVNLTIGNGVTSIGDDAFGFCKNLETVTLPNSVTSIGSNAFQSCTSLTSVIMGNSVATIGESAFGNCDSLTSVTIPDSVISVGDRAFYLCESLKEFIGKSASSDGRCLIIDGILISFAPAGVTEYTIPYGVTAIGNYAFYQCENITKVTIPDSVTAIGDYGFQDCENLLSVTIGNNVTTIGDSSFEYCTSLTSVIIPDSATSIGAYAFNYCKNLTDITIGNGVTFLGQGVLRNCDNLTSVTLGDSVAEIDYWAFEDCDKLASITIPSSVTFIGGNAFAECDNLTKIYCRPVTPPVVYNSNYWEAFDNNASGRKIYVPRNSINAYKSAEGWSNYASDIEGYDF